MLTPLKQSIPLTSKSTDIFGLFSLVNTAWSVLISPLIQIRWLFHWKKINVIDRGLQWLSKNIGLIYLFLTNTQLFTLQAVDWCHVDCCDVFLRCLNSCSEGTHSLQRIHWWAGDVMLHFNKSVEMNKQIHLLLIWTKWWVHFQKCFIFGQLLLKSMFECRRVREYKSIFCWNNKTSSINRIMLERVQIPKCPMQQNNQHSCHGVCWQVSLGNRQFG